MKKIFFIFFLSLFIFSCGNEGIETPEVVDEFDRSILLEDLADKIIIPSFESYVASLQKLEQANNAFIAKTDMESLDSLRSAWRSAYIQWQYVSMFEIGKAESIGLRNFTNIYPSDPVAIEQNIESMSFSLELPSTFDEQGFPALDYMLFGIAESDAMIIDRYIGDASCAQYLESLVDRLLELSQLVLDDWKDNYRDVFVSNVASSATGSVDKLVNDYIFYYEKFLRASKIGIPAGVFSGNTEPQTVEAIYVNDFSKTLALESLNAVQDFFNGRSHLDVQISATSLSDYLDYLNTIKSGADLNKIINDQFDLAREEIIQLDNSFTTQIETDNFAMLEAYDALQKNVVYLKVDMLQALNVRVDFVDADGD